MNKSPDDIVQINALVLRKQRDMLNAKAKAANLNVSKMVQKLIADATVIAKPDLSADIRKANAWLGRINSNLNMLSKWCNTYKSDVFSDLIAYRLSLIQADVTELATFTADLRAQGFGKRRQPRLPKKSATACQEGTEQPEKAEDVTV